MTTRFLALLLTCVLGGCASNDGGVRVSGEAYVALILAPQAGKPESPPPTADWWSGALKAASADPEFTALLAKTYGVSVTLTFLEKGQRLPAPTSPGLALGVRDGEATAVPSVFGKRHPALRRTFTVVGAGLGIHAHPERGPWREALKTAKTPNDRAVADFPLGWPDLPPLELALEDYLRRKLVGWRVLTNKHGASFATAKEHAAYVEAASDLYRKVTGWHDH